MMPRRGALVLILLLTIAPACVFREKTPGEDRVGLLSDRTYFNARGKVRTSASGRSVRMEQHEGRFVWAEYVAPWCGYCRQQSPETRQVDESTGSEVVFLTIMTSDMGGYGDPATQDTARAWAGQYGLDPDRVLAADLTAIPIPRHILYSPEGQMLFLQSGYLPAGRIREVLEDRMAGWTAWNKSGQVASWMKFR